MKSDFHPIPSHQCICEKDTQRLAVHFSATLPKKKQSMQKKQTNKHTMVRDFS